MQVINLLRERTSSVALTGTRSQSDDRLFRTLVDAHYSRVYNLAYRMVRSESDAADLTQEAFVRVYKALPRLRAHEAQGAWIRRIATNVCLDFLRRRKTSPVTEPLEIDLEASGGQRVTRDIADESSDPQRIVAGAERDAVLRRAISSLSDDYRIPLVLHHLEGMPVEEIAQIFEVPDGTIKSRLCRARRELKRKLGGYFDTM